MLQSEMFISLPSVDLAESKSFWSSMMTKVDDNVARQSAAKKQVVLQSISLITALSQGFSSAGVNDIISLMVDEDVVFLDTMGRDDDLKHALQAVLNLPPDKQSFQKVFLVLEHRFADLHLVIEATIHATFRDGSFPMRVRVMGRVNSLRPHAGETGPQYSGRIRDFVRDPEAVQVYRDQVTHQTLTIGRALEAALPGCPVKISKTIVRVTRLDNEQIQQMSRLSLGGQIPKPQYRPAPEAGTTGGLDDRYEYFYYDPYHSLLNWCLLDAMLSERTWRANHFRVLHPTGSILHKGDDLPAAIRGYGTNAFPATSALARSAGVACCAGSGSSTHGDTLE